MHSIHIFEIVLEGKKTCPLTKEIRYGSYNVVSISPIRFWGCNLVIRICTSFLKFEFFFLPDFHSYMNLCFHSQTCEKVQCNCKVLSLIPKYWETEN